MNNIRSNIDKSDLICAPCTSDIFPLFYRTQRESVVGAVSKVVFGIVFVLD
jgi:hypothetical protein